IDLPHSLLEGGTVRGLPARLDSDSIKPAINNDVRRLQSDLIISDTLSQLRDPGGGSTIRYTVGGWARPRYHSIHARSRESSDPSEVPTVKYFGHSRGRPLRTLS